MAQKPKVALVNFKKESFIIVEGTQNPDRFFVIREGRVRISKEAEIVKEEGSDILVPGDFFGVISTMSSHSHIETAQAITDVLLISIHKSQFEGLVQHNTPIAMKIILYFSQRMRYLDKALAQLTLKHSAEGEEGSALFNSGDYYDKQQQFTSAYYAYHQYIKYYPEGTHVQEAKDWIGKFERYGQSTTFEFDKTQLRRIYTKDTILFAEGEPGDELFIIENGSVKITKVANNNEIILAVLKPGDIFGEMALLESKPRSANAIAYEDCTVMPINWENFQSMAKTQPQIIIRLTQLLAERLWVIYKQLANTCIIDPIGRMYDALLTNLEKNKVPLEKFSEYTFNFGPKELAAMAGVPTEQSDTVVQQFLKETTCIRLAGDKIHTTSLEDIERQSALYKNLQRRQMALDQNKLAKR
ncbi:MAG: cyclic nucleotide-binding domain-containing protein [Treponema sp.]|jgi:CRP-like cAMP-binding protein|nr:cyclic nucleotide-binding domain-containing protein [Treponema sp.]